LILNSAKAGPPAVIQRLRESGVPLAQIEPEKGEVPFAGVISKIRQVGRVLGVPERGDRLAADVRADLRAVQAATAKHPKPKTLALFAHAGNRLMVSGGGTEAHAMLELIGLPNVAQHAKQWKPLSPEAFLASRPELIVLAAGGPGSDSDPNSPSSTLELARELLGPIGLDRTPAGQQKRVILVNPVEFLSGGPRVGLTAMSFARAVYPDLELPASKSRPWFAQVEGPAAESN
jgi:iron complex transport system substrate-binding protein